ncbi:MAG: hypothetical protein VZQ98_07315 [Bacteroidales bacterium]|nr:hypothetical protein [Bacteroidales bacterium]
MSVSRRTKKIIAVLAMVMTACLMLGDIHLLYSYYFSSILYYIYIPDWILWIRIGLEGIGIYISLLLWRERIRLKLFLPLLFLIVVAVVHI